MLPAGEQKWLWMVFGQMIRQPALRSEALSGWQRWIMKAVWRKPRVDKELVSWNTDQRRGLGCLRLVLADPCRLCVFKLHSFSQDCKILKLWWLYLHFSLQNFQSCFLSSAFLLLWCNQLLPFFTGGPFFQIWPARLWWGGGSPTKNWPQEAQDDVSPFLWSATEVFPLPATGSGRAACHD